MSLEDLDPQVAETLKSLHIDDEPANLSEVDIQQGVRMRDALGRWQSESFATLEVIRRRLLSDEPPTSAPEIAEVIAAVARFDGEDEFILPDLKAISRDILSRISPLPEMTRRETVSLVLSTHIKPLFLPTQHPMINQETGRKLHVPEGSRVAYPEFNDDQVWKTAGRGCWNTLRWTVSQLQRDDFEKLWPLLIPPLMTLLDDYQTIFRIKGIQVLHGLLEQVDGNLLKRTGIASLFSNSLLNSINRSTDPEIALILPLASRTLQMLIALTTEVGSRERFDQLCECLSTGVIGGVWIFAGENLEAMEASIETLLPLVDALDVGCCRYLKALVPQLTEVLAPKPFRPHSIRLINLSADCLLRLITVCKPRIHAWKDVILDALLRSWVWAKEDAKTEEQGVAEVQANLCLLCKALADACPSLYTEDFPALLEWNRELLNDLLPVNHAL